MIELILLVVVLLLALAIVLLDRVLDIIDAPTDPKPQYTEEERT